MSDVLALARRSAAESRGRLELLAERSEAWERERLELAKMASSTLQEASDIADGALASWRQMVADVREGRKDKVHASRSALLEVLALLRNTSHLGYTLLRKVASSGLPVPTDPDVLLPKFAALDKLLRQLTAEWHTADDLERLAVENYPVSEEELRRLAATKRPPAAWYEGDDNPF